MGNNKFFALVSEVTAWKSALSKMSELHIISNTNLWVCPFNHAALRIPVSNDQVLLQHLFISDQITTEGFMVSAFTPKIWVSVIHLGLGKNLSFEKEWRS